MISAQLEDNYIDAVKFVKPNPIKIDGEVIFVNDVLSKERLKAYFNLPYLFDELKQECWHCLDVILSSVREYKSEDEGIKEIHHILFEL